VKSLEAEGSGPMHDWPERSSETRRRPPLAATDAIGQVSESSQRCDEMHRAQGTVAEEDSMIHELAQFPIRAGSEAGFERDMLKARDVVSASPGFVSIEWWRGIERPNVYLVHLVWESVEAHLDGFRLSPAFEQWKALTRPHVDGEVSMEHFAPRSDAAGD
jgi:heme-degrading monooxygenase HmoA